MSTPKASSEASRGGSEGKAPGRVGSSVSTGSSASRSTKYCSMPAPAASVSQVATRAGRTRPLTGKPSGSQHSEGHSIK